MKQKNSKKKLFCFAIFMLPILAIAQEATKEISKAPKADLNVNILLCLLSFILLIPIYTASKAFNRAIKEHMFQFKKAKNNQTKISLLLLFLTMFQFANAQVKTKAIFSSDTLSYILFAIIILEIIALIFISWQTAQFIKLNSEEQSTILDTQISKPISPSFKEKALQKWGNIWNKMNSFKTNTEDADIDTGHNYDGIRELDNVTPPWFKAAFAASILFAAGYLYRYHIAQSAPMQIEELKIAIAEGEKEKTAYLANQKNKVDENNVTLLTDQADLAEGKSIYKSKCIACHQESGGSMPGGVGPNLTDNYWIHGGGIKDIFKTLKYGWPEKGMISWQDQIPPVQMAQLASYIKSLQNTNPPNAKESQGELYTEISTPTTSKVDSLPKKDSAVKK